mgnify:CR=1 FL=1|tara:strand:- start:164 stop:1024 length:861 start_codon:yes stop_codon:yes gene_type:complete
MNGETYRVLSLPAVIASCFFLLCAVVIFVSAFCYFPQRLVVVEYDLPHSGDYDDCARIKIAVLSDLHVGSPFIDLGKIRNIVDRTASLKPDLVLIPGDFVADRVAGGEVVSIDLIAGTFLDLASRVNVVATLGNHDWHYGAVEVERALRDAGIIVLENRTVNITVRDCQLTIVGLSDFWEGDTNYAQVLKTKPMSSRVVYLTHNSDLFNFTDVKVQGLIVSGHTHGGQVSIPIFGPLIIPSINGKKYAKGVYQTENGVLFVSSGIGTSILGVRFFVTPEISILYPR